ncbi:uncharacterized protein SCHCODRAFT_02495629 [Schizophyllum commune H4-8]|nr:uncharacterized protein SCHCODRAFT_02495629 [Schizophyllum commune H4-8]KAI5895076.1 hypothetical protein SCHCODRAFT_02495629 [Schizophyllum commune H4-8]
MQTSTLSDTPDPHHPNCLTVTRNPEQYGKLLFTNAPQIEEPVLLVPEDMVNEQTAPTTTEMDKYLVELRHQWAVFAAYRNTRAPIS